jgi:RNA polymerase sigma factor (sigma-70 family)
MATNELGQVLQRLRQAVVLPDGAGMTDGQLLGCFVERRDEAAFAALVKRHGPMVWGVCRRILGQRQDAEDAFQAAFLVLVRKAAAVLPREMLANWLYGVARQTALQARRAAVRRKARERQVSPMPDRPAVPQDLWREWQPLLDEELARLPDKYRAVVVLCDLQGRPRKEAARQLALPEGTVASRLSRARALLARRLARLAPAVSGGAVAAVLAEHAAAAVPAAVLLTTLQAALAVGAGQPVAAGGCVSPRVAALAEQVLNPRSALRPRLLLSVLLLAVALGGAGLAGSASVEPPEPAPSAAAQEGAALPGKAAPGPTPQDGAPLPAGALARLGMPRHRFGLEVHMALAPDGKTAVTLSSAFGPGLHFWDVASGKLLRSIDAGGSAVAYSPDGRWVATVNWSIDRITDGKVCLWDAATGKEFAQLQLPTKLLLSVAFSPDGTRLAVGGEQVIGKVAQPDSKSATFLGVWHWDGTALKPLWQATPDVESPLQSYHNPGIGSVAFSADGKYLAAGGFNDKSIRLHSAADGKELRRFNASGTHVKVAFAPGGNVLASGGEDGAVALWDPASGTKHWEKMQVGEVQALAFAPDGKTLAVGGGHCMVLASSRSNNNPFLVLLDAASGNETRRLVFSDSVASVAYSRDGKVLAAALNVANTLRFWDSVTGKELPWGEGHSGYISAVAVAEDGRLAATGGNFGQLLLWDLARGKEVGRLEGHRNPVFAAKFVPGGKLLVSAGYDQTIRLWDLASGNEVRQLQVPAKEGYPNSFALSPDGKLLAAGNYHEGRVHVWDLATGQRLHTLEHGGPGVRCLAFAPDGTTLAVGELNRTEGNNRIVLWNAGAGKKLRAFPGDDDGVVSLAFAPDGRLLASTGHHNEPLAFWEVATGKKLFNLPCAPKGVVAFSPDGKTIAWASQDDSIYLWEIASKQVRHKFAGRAEALAFSPDGRTLLTDSWMDATALVWDVTGLGRQDKPPAALSPGELQSLWKALASPDAAQAGRAIWSLTAAPKQAVPFVVERMQELSRVDARQIERSIADLDSPSFKVRDAAARQLLTFGKVAEPTLRQALDRGPSLEVSRRIQKLLQTVEAADPWLRAMEVLEHIGSATARKALEQFAGQTVDASYRQEALAAAHRLAKIAKGRK